MRESPPQTLRDEYGRFPADIGVRSVRVTHASRQRRQKCGNQCEADLVRLEERRFVVHEIRIIRRGTRRYQV